MDEDKTNALYPLGASNKDMECDQTSPLGEGKREESTVPHPVDNYNPQGSKRCRGSSIESELVDDTRCERKLVISHVTPETVRSCCEHSHSLDELCSQMKTAQIRAEHFRRNFDKLKAERTNEQNELARLITELKEQIHIVLTERDSTKDLGMIGPGRSYGRLENLQNCVNHLLEANTKQEELLSELTDRLASSDKAVARYTAALEKGTELLASVQKRAGWICNMTPVSDDPSDIMAQLDACFKLLQRRDELQQLKLQDLEQKITDNALEHKRQMEQLRHIHSKEMHEKQQLFHEEMLQAIKRAESATVEARKLSLEATNLKSIMEAEMKTKTEEIGRLKNVVNAKEGTGCEHEHETATVKNDSQQEIARLIKERDAAVSKHSVLTTKLEAVEAYMAELEGREMYDSKNFYALKRELSEAKQKTKKLKHHLEDVVKWINKFNAMVAEYFALPVENFSENSTRIDQLHAFTKAVQAKCKSVEFNSHHRSMGGKPTCTSPCNFDKTKRRFAEGKQQMSDVHEELETLKDSLDRMKSERDYYLLVINEKTEELSSIKAEYQLQLKEVAKLKRSKARLDELTKQIQLLRGLPKKPTKNCCERQENSNTQCCHFGNHSTVNKPLLVSSASDVEQSSVISEAAKSEFNGRSVDNGTSGQRHDNPGEPMAQERSAISLRRPDESLRTTEHSATSTTSSKSMLQLQHRLAELEMKMLQAAEEKASLRIRNNQMADLLFRMTQHNQKLIRELEDNKDRSPVRSKCECGSVATEYTDARLQLGPDKRASVVGTILQGSQPLQWICGGDTCPQGMDTATKYGRENADHQKGSLSIPGRPWNNEAGPKSYFTNSLTAEGDCRRSTDTDCHNNGMHTQDLNARVCDKPGLYNISRSENANSQESKYNWEPNAVQRKDVDFHLEQLMAGASREVKNSATTSNNCRAPFSTSDHRSRLNFDYRRLIPKRNCLASSEHASSLKHELNSSRFQLGCWRSWGHTNIATQG